MISTSWAARSSARSLRPGSKDREVAAVDHPPTRGAARLYQPAELGVELGSAAREVDHPYRGALGEERQDAVSDLGRHDLPLLGAGLHVAVMAGHIAQLADVHLEGLDLGPGQALETVISEGALKGGAAQHREGTGGAQVHGSPLGRGPSLLQSSTRLGRYKGARPAVPASTLRSVGATEWESAVSIRLNPRDPDDPLIPRLLARDPAAFSTLIDRYQRTLLRLARSFVPSQAVAEEVVQETWLAVLEGLAKFERRSTLKSWIFRILTNRARTRGVRENRTTPFAALGTPDGDPEPVVEAARFSSQGMWATPPRRWEDDTAEKALIDKRAVAALEGALELLPQSQRAVVTLRDVEGLDSEEVCNILEISETNQRVLLHRARSKLRAVLESHMERP